MSERAHLITVAGRRPSARGLLGFFGWMLLSLMVVAMAVLSAQLFATPGEELRLGPDLPLGVLEDQAGTLSATQVAALPDSAFTWRHEPFSKGYSSSVHWLRVHAPARLPAGEGPLWLSVMPPHLDRLTLYQRGPSGWVEHTSGDTIPASQRVRTRQLLFPVLEEQPLLLRLSTTHTIQMYGSIWRDSGLLAELSRVEWASGAHLGIYLLLALLIGGAALALRIRSLTASAILAVVVLVHSTNVGGYPWLWLPEHMVGELDTMKQLGVFVLVAAVAWQGREFFTQGTAWRRLDRFMVAHTAVLLLAMLSVPAGRYAQWAWLAFFSPWLTAILCAAVAWTNMWRRGVTPVRALRAAPYTLHALLGLHMAATYLGLMSMRVEPPVIWQVETLLLEIMIMVAVGANLIARFQHAQRRQVHLLQKLAHAKQVLDERVRQRTAELQQTQQTQQTLQATLASEREMRNEQRQFFHMVNHEFRTPLAIMDSAAAEQLAFPSSELELHERATQIRRACRRMTALVDNCLVGDRLNARSFQPRLEPTSVAELVNDAAQLAQWSHRHQLRLDLADAPEAWACDPMLTRIALSNLVDNAVKHAVPGEIGMKAQVDARGNLRLSVCDQGPGLSPEATRGLFERGQRGEDTRTPGFGLGLWVARRIAQLHGGEVEVTASAPGGTCFALVLPEPSIARTPIPCQTLPAPVAAGPWPPASCAASE